MQKKTKGLVMAEKVRSKTNLLDPAARRELLASAMKVRADGGPAALLDLLNEAYVFIAMRHKACNPWRVALDDWQARVEKQTGWSSFDQIEKFNQNTKTKESPKMQKNPQARGLSRSRGLPGRVGIASAANRREGCGD